MSWIKKVAVGLSFVWLVLGTGSLNARDRDVSTNAALIEFIDELLPRVPGAGLAQLDSLVDTCSLYAMSFVTCMAAFEFCRGNYRETMGHGAAVCVIDAGDRCYRAGRRLIRVLFPYEQNRILLLELKEYLATGRSRDPDFFARYKDAVCQWKQMLDQGNSTVEEIISDMEENLRVRFAR